MSNLIEYNKDNKKFNTLLTVIILLNTIINEVTFMIFKYDIKLNTMPICKI